LGRQAQYVISKPYIIFLYVFSPWLDSVFRLKSI
jgi:hypothetical protein